MSEHVSCVCVWVLGWNLKKVKIHVSDNENSKFIYVRLEFLCVLNTNTKCEGDDDQAGNNRGTLYLDWDVNKVFLTCLFGKPLILIGFTLSELETSSHYAHSRLDSP